VIPKRRHKGSLCAKTPSSGLNAAAPRRPTTNNSAAITRATSQMRTTKKGYARRLGAAPPLRELRDRRMLPPAMGIPAATLSAVALKSRLAL
jgi:hypothetical protein